VGTGRKFVLLVLAAGLLRAADSPELIYRLHLSNHVTRVEWTSAKLGNWDVTVSVDAVTCELVCAYRLKRGSPAAHILAPPPVVVHVYSDAVSLPERVTVDPAGLEFPVAAGKLRPQQNFGYLPARKIFAAAPPWAREDLQTSWSRPWVASTNRLAAFPALTAPLRI